MAEPVSKYRALLKDMEKKEPELFQALTPELKVKLLASCVSAAALTNGIDELRRAINYGLEQPDVVIPPTNE